MPCMMKLLCRPRPLKLCMISLFASLGIVASWTIRKNKPFLMQGTSSVLSWTWFLASRLRWSQTTPITLPGLHWTSRGGKWRGRRIPSDCVEGFVGRLAAPRRFRLRYDCEVVRAPWSRDAVRARKFPVL